MAYPVLGDFVEQVRFNLGGRTDIDEKISNWLKKAYREIAMGFPLETLESSTQNQTVAGQDSYDYPDDARALKSLVLVNQNSPVPLVKKNIQVVRRYLSTTQGVPAIWGPFNTVFILRPVPNDNYTLYVDYWQKPAISADETDVATINECEVQLPDDWFEILEQSATQKGHADLQEADKAMAVRQLLNGDPRNQAGFPGMIKERLTRDASENVLSDYGMRPRIRRYTSTR